MTVTEYIVEKLVANGISVVFGYQGGNISRLIDTLAFRPDIRFVQTYHEQGAAFSANGYARVRGGLGVAIASSGPGALNLINGIADAWFDSVPCLFIAGDVSRTFDKKGLPLRQNGFQATDIVSIVRPITKYAVKISALKDFTFHFDRAIAEAISDRPGPVLLSLPHWLQRMQLEKSEITISKLFPKKDLTMAGMDRACSALSSSLRPLLLVGGGARAVDSRNLIAKFLERHQVPVVASLCGLDVVSHDHPAFIGFIGDYGQPAAQLAFAASDCVLVLGSRLDERQVSALGTRWTEKLVVHIDSDPAELENETDRYVPVCASLQDILPGMLGITMPGIGEWRKIIADWTLRFPSLPNSDNPYPHRLLRRISETLPDDTRIFADVGLHQMCVAQAIRLDRGLRLFNSAGLGSMGFALPAAIGASFARAGEPILCVCGDGGLQMNLQELQTLSRERLPVKVLVLNNRNLGMIRELQTKIYDGRFAGSVDGYEPCNFEKVANAFGIPYCRIGVADPVPLLLSSPGPVLIEVECPSDMAVIPALAEEVIAHELALQGAEENQTCDRG